MRSARRGLVGDGSEDQTFGTASPGGMMGLAIVRGLRTKGWTRVAALILAIAFLVGAVAIVASMLFG